MLKVIRNLLLKIVDDIDAGNSNITEGEALEIVDSLKRFTDKEKRLSKYAACEYLNVSRATFDNYVRFLPKEEMEQEAKAITINQYGASLVAINSKRGSSIIHEAEHIKNSIWRYIGAKEICERYRGILPTSATVADVYVAINSQYHDYAELFKNWFGDGIEQKIVESAIVFWFKDADCKAENKVVEYLGEY